MNEEPAKICPKFSAVVVCGSEPRFVEVPCIKERCVWWITNPTDNNGNCRAVVDTYTLAMIADHLAKIRKIKENEYGEYEEDLTPEEIEKTMTDGTNQEGITT